jgi:hypothetical protein
VVVLTVTASEPKNECMWLVNWPGTTIGSMFLFIKRLALVTVYAWANPAPARKRARDFMVK